MAALHRSRWYWTRGVGARRHLTKLLALVDSTTPTFNMGILVCAHSLDCSFRFVNDIGYKTSSRKLAVLCNGNRFVSANRTEPRFIPRSADDKTDCSMQGAIVTPGMLLQNGSRSRFGKHSPSGIYFDPGAEHLKLAASSVLPEPT